MLFILRQLRRLELRKRSGQYFVYAIGEMVLIVVGILIALQINEWKAEKELERQRVELIENLKNDFQASVDRAEQVIREALPIEERHTKYLQAIAGEIDGLSVDDIRTLRIRSSVDFQPVMATYRSAISTGAIGLIKDADLNQLFIEFEDQYALQQNLRRMHQEEVFSSTGSIAQISLLLGDPDALGDSPSSYAKKFELTDEEFMDIVSQKEFYALQNINLRINHTILVRVKNMRAKAEEILDRLEEL